MTLLLDAHALLWLFWDDRQLSANARAMIMVPTHRKLVSVATCWEIAIKASIGKLQLGEPAGTFLAREMATSYFDLLPIAFEHAVAVEALPLHHRDPFDRMLAAQARTLPAAPTGWSGM